MYVRALPESGVTAPLSCSVVWAAGCSTFASCDHRDASWGAANAEDVGFLEEWYDEVCPFP